MLPDFMQCLLFALIQFITSYLKSSFYLKQLLFSLSILLHVRSAWSIRPPIGQALLGRGFQLGAWEFLSMEIISEYFKCKPRCTNIQNLFKNRIFVISIKNCTLQLNFKAHLPVVKYYIFNAKSLIQPTWHHLLPENVF